jgi:DNA recombination protein RmuC
MTIFYILIAALLSGVAVFIFCNRRYQQSLQTTNNLYQQAEKERAVAVSAAEQFEKQLNENRLKFEEYRAEIQELSNSLARSEELVKFGEEKLKTQKEELESMKEQFRKEFENLANRILDEKSQKFTEQNKTNLDILLNPLKEKIKTFEEKVELVYKTEAAERNSLRGEIKNLVELNKKISEEANQLAQALKGDTKQQGDWGELVLDKILEHSGLEKDREYVLQFSTENADGERIKPDAVIYLPDNKHIIIDAKVSLKAYNDFSNATGETESRQALKMHITSVKNHVRNLSEKYYQTAKGLNSPDFILMFVPIESSFSAAVKADHEIFNYAWERRIVIVSPSTLLATLRTIASIWKQERQTRNALQIAEEGGKMYDKLVGFVEDLINVGKKMDDAKKEYAQAMNKLMDGSGNLVKRAEKMKELGAKATKSIPQQILDRAE